MRALLPAVIRGCRLVAPVILALLLSLPAPAARGADPAGSLRKLLDKGRPEAVVKKAAAWMGKDPEREDAREIRDLWAQAAYEVLQGQPDLIAAQAFLARFPRHALADPVAEIEAELALEAARALDVEAVYLGLARQYRGVPAADDAEAAAEEMSFQRVSASGEPDDLRAHTLRYPWGAHSTRARAQETEQAYARAEAAADSDAWQRLLDRYPDHPRGDEARARLEETSWTEFQQTGGEASELWAFVAEHPDSDEGWAAAVEAMEQTVSVRFPDGSAASGNLENVLPSLVVDMGTTPPPGYEIGVDVEVDLGDGWRPWADAALELAEPLALTMDAFEGLDLSESRMSGATISWWTPTPLCSEASEPLPARARVRMAHGERQHERTAEFQVTGTCPGARRMVLLRLGDDLEGPVAMVHRNPASGQDVVMAPPGEIHETWTCSHVMRVEPEGVTLSCGPTTARLGWTPGVMWLRRTDPSVPTTDRVALLPVEDLPDAPLQVTTPRRGRSPVLQDAAGARIAELAEREAVCTPALAAAAFGARSGTLEPAPRVDPGRERPVQGGGVPLPQGAARRSVEVRAPSSADIRAWHATLQALGLPGATPKRVLVVDGEAPGDLENALLANVFVQDEAGVMQVHGLLLARLGEGEFDWYQAILLPRLGDLAAAQWERFELDGRVYLRTAGPSPEPGACARLFTLRDGPGHMVVDVTDLACSP